LRAEAKETLAASSIRSAFDERIVGWKPGLGAEGLERDARPRAANAAFRE
jgi:hypothetical protein